MQGELINAPSRRQVEDSLVAEKSKSALLKRLEGLADDEQHAVLLDLVRSHVSAVLGGRSPEVIDSDWAFQELGFDSLKAVELRNRLKAATGLALPTTVIFDYPNSGALAGYLHGELFGDAVAPAEIDKDLAAMDLDDLVNAAFMIDDDDG
jgi:mycoketide-CoA synthase